MKRILSILICGLMVLPMASQQKNATPNQKRSTTVSQPKRTDFQFKIQWDASFKKDGENNFYVVDFGRKSAHQLYMDVLSHIASIYRNPEYVTSKVEDRSIVINGYADEITSFKNRYNHYYLVGLKYRLELQFKDGKIRVDAPTTIDVYAESSSNINKYSEYASTTSGLYYMFEAKKTVLDDINKYINALITAIVYGSKDNDW